MFNARHADIEDLFRNLTGTLLGLVLQRRYSAAVTGRYLFPARALVLVALAIQCVPFFKTVTDEVIAHSYFPVLAVINTPFELDRWKANADISIE